jgi:hypothetical protein
MRRLFPALLVSVGGLLLLVSLFPPASPAQVSAARPAGALTPTQTPTFAPSETPTIEPSATPTDCPLYFFDGPPVGPFYLYVRCRACGVAG